MSKNIIIGCDHAAFNLKEALKNFLETNHFEVSDIGVHNKIPVDYPDIASEVAIKISTGIFKLGLLICGTGIGMSMVANRYPNVRAALCNDILSAKMSKCHNNANILVMGARIINESLAINITKIWLETKFEKGRHERRLEKVNTIDYLNFVKNQSL